MVNSLSLNLVETVVPKCVGDIPILLIDHDATSIASLTILFEQFSCKVMSMNVASKALSIIAEHKDIGLVIANTETPHIESHYFLTALFQRNIPLILITPEINVEQKSKFLTERACYCLQKPFYEIDIINMWQHVSHMKNQKLENINIAGKKEKVIDEDMKKIGFREKLKMLRPSQISLIGKRPIIQKFKTPETYQTRKGIANDDVWKTNLVYPAEIQKEKPEWRNVHNNVGRRKTLWTDELHIRFLAALSILGEENYRPKAILEIMNVPNLTKRQISSYLQRYKIEVERINAMPRIEFMRSTNKFKYPFDTSYLRKSINTCNSLWYPPSSSTSQLSVLKPFEERNTMFYLGGELDLENHSFVGSTFNQYSPMEVNSAPPAISNNLPYNNLRGPASASVSSNNLPILSGLPSSVRASNKDTFQMGCIPQPNPNPFQSPSSIPETNRNHIGYNPTSILDAYVPQVDIGHMEAGYNVVKDCNMNRYNTNINQMGSTSSYVPTQNMISTTQEAYGETNFDVLNSVIHPETKLENTSLVHYDDSYDVSIEDLISFDTNINDMDMQSCLGDYGRDIPRPIDQVHPLVLLGSTSRQQREDLEGQADNMDLEWIDQVLNEDA